MSRPGLNAIPITPTKAARIVARLHRHHGPIPQGYSPVCIACVDDGRICGVVVIGRPINRNSDDGQTLEVLRLATDGTRNAPSFLLGTAAKTARAMGAARLITYTLDSETGASLRGAGWNKIKDGIQSWWTTTDDPGRSVRHQDHYNETKTKWSVQFRAPILVSDVTLTDPPAIEGLTLFVDEVLK